jgi:valyl-tRNA synthetase
VDSKFDFKKLEGNIYKQWEKSGAFSPKIDKKRKPYTIIMPPPNAYDQLHIGHALEVALQDVLVRYHRLKGEPTLWLPGADHAGLASQIFFERVLQKEKGISRHDLGRTKFVEELAAFQQTKISDTQNQLKQLGASCDWNRFKYTLDEDVSRAVVHTFKKMYDDGLIYKGKRVINWSPKSQTGLSDLEVVHKEIEGQLVSIKYPVKEGGEIIVATTRPETMLGDTAVAVNPKDKRYKDMVGKTVLLPLMEREIPVIADEYVDMKFGTGAVKVTPAHDPNDFAIAQRHSLEIIEIIDNFSRITDAGGTYQNMKVLDAREAVMEDLKKAGLLLDVKNFVHSVPHSERSGEPVEQLLSEQWFVKIAPLAKLAIDAVKSGKIKFVTKRFEKIYLNWMANIHDWNISRQVWWGHRIPVWYNVGSDLAESLKSTKSIGHTPVVSFDNPGKKDGTEDRWVQDTDTLDTWFSSGLWPMTTLGWPEKTADMKYFYPTTVMAPGWDILFFWVARMIMMGVYCTGEIPFEHVYLHGLVRDGNGEKISRSKGNTVDPLEMIEKYGADALRMGLMMGMAVGGDTNISEDKIRAYRNFANKIWNASRFINMQEVKPKSIEDVTLTPADKKLIKEFEKVAGETTRQLDKFQISLAGEELYQYFWHRFCDEYIENSKEALYGDDEKKKTSAVATLNYILQNSLILLHPFVPFVTEAIWQELYKGQLIGAEWPK